MMTPLSEIYIAPLHLMKGGGGAEKRAVELRASLELAAVKKRPHCRKSKYEVLL